MRLAVSFEPVKATPRTRSSSTRAAPTSPPPGSKWSTSARHACLMKEAGGKVGGQRGLFGRLGENGIAGAEGR